MWYPYSASLFSFEVHAISAEAQEEKKKGFFTSSQSLIGEAMVELHSFINSFIKVGDVSFVEYALWRQNRQDDKPSGFLRLHLVPLTPSEESEVGPLGPINREQPFTQATSVPVEPVDKSRAVFNEYEARRTEKCADSSAVMPTQLESNGKKSKEGELNRRRPMPFKLSPIVNRDYIPGAININDSRRVQAVCVTDSEKLDDHETKRQVAEVKKQQNIEETIQSRTGKLELSKKQVLAYKKDMVPSLGLASYQADANMTVLWNISSSYCTFPNTITHGENTNTISASI